MLPKEVQPSLRGCSGSFPSCRGPSSSSSAATCLQLLYKPKEKASLPSGYAAEQLKKLGPWSREEKIVLVVMCIALVCWMLERELKIPPLSWLARCLYLRPDQCLDVLTCGQKYLDMMIFYGGLFGIAVVFPFLKIDKWMGSVVTPYVAPLVGNPYLFIAALAVCNYIIRTFIISVTATLTLFMLMIIPVASVAGYNPWIIGIVTYASMWVWHLLYQNALNIPAFYAVEGLVEQKQMAKLSVAYMIISILGFWACIPVWQLMGLIKTSPG
jgi:DASS family divalent anion:Na+ symporter